MSRHHQRRPRWLKVPMPAGRNFHDVRVLLRQNALHTVCQSAHCPNIGDCWSRRTATFMILGDACTRNCRFCAVTSAHPAPPDPEEPERLARAAEALNLRYVVVTSVTRDDLPDGGGEHFARTIRALKEHIPGAQIEVLVPDFLGDADALNTVLAAKPDVLNHNIETIARLYPEVRPAADYERSLTLLRRAADSGAVTKSGMMLGLGESYDEVLVAMADLRAAGCAILTLGQYLAPSKAHFSVQRFVPPEEFETLKQEGERMGFSLVAAGPLVRSSYHADEAAALCKKVTESAAR